MKHIVVLIFLMICCDYVAAQESHYHRSLRSQDTEYGLTQEPHFNGSGMLWSRTRNVDGERLTPIRAVKCLFESLTYTPAGYLTIVRASYPVAYYKEKLAVRHRVGIRQPTVLLIGAFSYLTK